MRGFTLSRRRNLMASCVMIAALFAAGIAWAVLPQPANIVKASLLVKTDRYGHNVLGGNEYAQIRFLYLPGGGDIFQRRSLALPSDRVFEDIEARVTDLDGDGFNEVVVVESSDHGGAQLVVYGVPGPRGNSMLGEDIVKLAATPPIGRPFRWLAPAGIADFNGDGQNDIAYVETPHIGGILRIWTLRDGNLVEIASDYGYSNHRIGEDFITGGVRDCGDGPELVLPDAGWRRTMVARLNGDAIEAVTLSNEASGETITHALECR